MYCGYRSYRTETRDINSERKTQSAEIVFLKCMKYERFVVYGAKIQERHYKYLTGTEMEIR